MKCVKVKLRMLFSNKFRISEWQLLIILWVAFFLNQADRQIFNVTLPLIREDIDLTDAEFGLIASSLIWAYGFLVPVAGFLGDIFSRRNILAFCILFWSIATFFTGFASGLIPFVLLLGIATGGGEAFYAPAANALLSERYVKNRAFALSVHQTAVYTGIILSGVLAGYIGEQFGWRRSFNVFGMAGIVLSVIFMVRIKNEQETARSSMKEIKKSLLDAISVFKKPTVIMLTLAFACMVFVNVGYLTWMPLFLVEKYDMSVTYAGFSSLIYHHVGAFFGVMLGSRLSDKLALTDPGKRLVIQSVALAGGAPFIFLMGFSGSQLITYVALALFGVMRGIYDSNIFASLYEVVKPSARSSATGFMLMFAFLMGAFAPLLLGILKPTLGLAASFSSLSVFYAAGAGFIFLAVKFFFKTDFEVRTSN
jgi:MFS family permease